jgi:Tol biopolymer transport system component
MIAIRDETKETVMANRLKTRLGTAAAAIAAFWATGVIAIPPFAEWSAPVSAELGSDSDLNTAANDGCPIQSPDGLQLFMASNRPGSSGLDIWVATRGSTEDGWGKPERLPAPVNSTFDEFCPTPVRGHRLFFVSRRDDPNGDIYETRLGPNGWSVPVRLGPNINSSAQEWSPSYFEDGEGRPVLYFSSTRGGNQDLYASTDWGPAQPVGELNTAADDARPNVRRDGLEIVFDSTRAPTLGGPDIWFASRESTSAPWGVPVHLAALSSPAGDTRASLSWDGATMVFGSARSPGEGSADIYVTHRGSARGNFGKTVTFPGPN